MAERRDEVFPVILHTAEWFAMAARSPAVSSTGATIASATVITSMTGDQVVKDILTPPILNYGNIVCRKAKIVISAL